MSRDCVAVVVVVAVGGDVTGVVVHKFIGQLDFSIGERLNWATIGGRSVSLWLSFILFGFAFIFLQSHSSSGE